MEDTLLGKEYMNLPLDDVWQLVVKLRERCKAFDGAFTLLWHNHMLIDEKMLRLYRSIMASG